jgi:hypothetical protein
MVAAAEFPLERGPHLEGSDHRIGPEIVACDLPVVP